MLPQTPPPCNTPFTQLVSKPMVMAAFANPVLSQDHNQAAAFIAALTGSPDTIMNWRGIHETDRSIAARPRRGTLNQCWPELCQMNAQGFGIYATIAETNGGTGNEHVTGFRAQYIDLDGIDANQRFTNACAWDMQPQFYVQSSPGKFHIYWKVEKHGDPARFTTVQRKLVTKFNGDPTVIDPARIMRLPGSLHMKNPTAPTVVQYGELPAIGHTVTSQALDLNMWNVAPSDLGGSGGDRLPIGEGDRAPSTHAAIEMLNRIDVVSLSDRNQWVAIVGAFMQSINVFDPAEYEAAYQAFMAWNEPYPGNDPAANVKVWADTAERGTSVKGWNRLHKEGTGLTAQQARLMTGQVAVTGADGVQVAPQATIDVDTSGFGRSMGAQAAQDSLGDMLHDATIANAPSALIEVVKVIIGRISVGFNTFSQQILLLTAPPWAKSEAFPRPWSDTDTVNCQLFVQTLFNEKGVLRPGKDTVFDAISLVASHSKFNPLHDYLNSLQWDGVCRLQNMLPKYFGTDDTHYHQMVGEKFMISAIARAMKPGCKVDTVLILEGKQGVKKSSSVAALAGEAWFTDELPDLTTKDAAIQLVGKWIVEISELSAFNKSDIETIKKFMSRSIERFRAPYGKVASDHPRQAVFVATTNDDHYLKDTTGNRRFWPVKCGRIDIAAIRDDRDQLWAEAMAMYRDGAQWWLTDEEGAVAEAEQEARREVDPWEEQIARIAEATGSLPLTINMICAQLGIPFERRNAAANSRISKCLRLCGYERKRLAAGSDGKRWWAYLKN